MLSIIIPSYCRPDLLQRCLQSVSLYAPPQCEIIIVDDASPDDRIRQTVSQFPGVGLLRLPQRGGFCTAVNAGIEAATGAIVEVLNDDAEVTRDWASAALNWFRDPKVAAVAPLVTTGPNDEWIDSAGDRYFVGGVAGKRGHFLPTSSAVSSPCYVFGASASSAFYRRSALLHVGGFPDSFSAYFDDVDVAFRLQRAGYRTVFDPASRVRHHISASHGCTGRRLLEQQSRNEERVFWRNIPRATLWKTFWQHLAVLAGKAHRRWSDGTLAPFVMGRLRVLMEAASICRHRRQLRTLGPDAPPSQWHIESFAQFRQNHYKRKSHAE